MPGGTKLLAFAALAALTGSLMLLAQPASASPGWEVVLDRPTPNFGAVDFVSDSEGWMVAGAGLLHTTDGGATWTEAAKITVNDVDFFDREHGWAVGPSGAIYGTTDRGVSWTAQRTRVASNMAFVDVTAISASEAWAVALQQLSDVAFIPIGSALLHTTDGGNTWLSVDLPPLAWFSQIDFAGASGWVLGSTCVPDCATPENIRGALLRTTDGGASWALGGSVPDGAANMDFADALHGWLATTTCSGSACSLGINTYAIHRTDDGGQTWQAVDVTDLGGLPHLSFADAANGWGVSVQCDQYDDDCRQNVIVTDDGGLTWRLASSSPTEPTRSVRSVRATNGGLYVIGLNVALRSRDGGETWVEMATPALTLTHLDFIDRETGFAVHGPHLVGTKDGGRTWQRRGSPSVTGFARLAALRFFDESLGIAALERCQDTCRTDVASTDDGGNTWTLVATLPSATTSGLKDLRIGSGGAGVVATAESLGITTDYGATWTLRSVPPEDGFAMLDPGIADATHIWVSTYPRAGGPPALLESSDAGETWHEVYRGVPLGDFEFFDAQHGWARAGEEYLRTNDGGRTWETITLPTANRIYEVAFADPLNGWASIVGGCDDYCAFQLMHTADGGATWTQQGFHALDDAVAHDLDFVDAQTGWFTTSPAQVFGLGGDPPDRTVLYRTTDAGGGPVVQAPELPKLGGGFAPTGSSPLLPILLAAAAVASISAALVLQRRRL